MPEYHIPFGTLKIWRTLDQFTRGYWEAAFFCNQEEIGALTVDAISKPAWERAIKDCKEFQTDNAKLLTVAYSRPDYSQAQAGRDFWFTRNGHGVGFWDRKTLAADNLGDKLSNTCKHRHVEIDLYVGDDDQIYFM